MSEKDWEFTPGRPLQRYSSEDCFVCGSNNPVGFRAKLYTDGEMAWTEVTPPVQFQGFNGVLHGGMVSSLLDETLWYALYCKGFVTLTVDLSVRLRKSAPPGRPLRVEAQMADRDRRFLVAQGRLIGLDGELYATAQGRFLEVSPEKAHLQGIIRTEEL